MKAALFPWLALCAAALGDVQVAVCVIEMPKERASELMEGSLSGDALFDKSRGFVKAGQAKLFETSVVRVNPGEKGTAESFQLRIAPYEMGAVGCTLFSTPASGTVAPPPPPPPQQLRMPKVFTAFEARSVGGLLEADATPGAGGNVDVGVMWNFVSHAGYTISEDWTDPPGNRHQLKQPVYVSFKTQFSRTLASGRWMLVEVKSSSAEGGKIDPDRKLVVFARADDLHPKK